MAAVAVAPGAARADTIGAFDLVCAFTGNGTASGNAIQWVGGGGGFNFTSFDVVCTGTRGGLPYAASPVITASGYFTSLVCGTSAIGADAQGAATIYPIGSADFSIVFAGAQEVISGTFDGLNNSHGRMSGYVTIAPNSFVTQGVAGGQAANPQIPLDGDFSDTCINNFAAAGSFALIG